MITKAIIKQLYTDTNNHYMVYIPYLRKANMEEADATLQATAVYVSGISQELHVGDIVYVGFEDNNLSNPIILGKLFTNNKNENISTVVTAKTQLITDSCKLPVNTYVDNINIDTLAKRLYNINTENNLNIQLYRHNILMYSDSNSSCVVFSVLSPISYNIDNIEGLEKLLGKITKPINVGGICYPTDSTEKYPIYFMSWKGSFAMSTLFIDKDKQLPIGTDNKYGIGLRLVFINDSVEPFNLFENIDINNI